jgi:hypothetical protein
VKIVARNRGVLLGFLSECSVMLGGFGSLRVIFAAVVSAAFSGQ